MNDRGFVAIEIEVGFCEQELLEGFRERDGEGHDYPFDGSVGGLRLRGLW